MLLSIIVPTYNVEDFIANCLESLLNQNISKEDYEVLVINDGSTDDSAKIAANFADNHKNVKLINQENKGLSGARNTGIHLAKGKYTYFIDSDDYIAANTLGSILSILKKYELDVLGVKELETKRLDIKKSSNLNAINDYNIKISDGITFIAENNYINNAWWYFIKTDFLKKTGLIFPVGRLVEDANFTSKLLVTAKKMTSIPLDFYRYYMRPNSIMHRTNIEHVKRLINDYTKNVFEFNDQINELKKIQHPNINSCIERLQERQQSFVFFQLIKILRFGVLKNEVVKMLDDYKKIDVYPLTKFTKRDFSKSVYKILMLIVNNEKLYLALLKIR